MKFITSIKWQLLVWQMILLGGVLLTLLPLHYHFHRRHLIAAIDKELQESLLITMPVISPPQNAAPKPFERGGPEGMRPPRAGRLLPQRLSTANMAGDLFLDELSESGMYVYSQGTRGTESYGRVPGGLRERVEGMNLQDQIFVSHTGNRELIHPHYDQQLVVIGRSLADVDSEMAVLRGHLLLIGMSVLLAGLGGGWLMVSRALRPVRQISATAKTIAAGEHHHRIELSDAPDELASLAQTLNHSFDHLDEAIETQKQFSADASHELRTPVAVVIAQTEAALKRERTPEEYQAVLGACLRAGQRMKQMVNSLLELTRLAGTVFELSKERCDLNALLSSAADSGSLFSKIHPVRFHGLPALSKIEGGNSQEVEVDSDRIHQVVMNLISNAVQHNPQGCEIAVRLKQGGIIEVADNGIGIPEASLPHLFERFYRVDTSRSREQGGVGLGLSIAKSLVEAHGGTIAVTSAPDRGTTFMIHIPLLASSVGAS